MCLRITCGGVTRGYVGVSGVRGIEGVSPTGNRSNNYTEPMKVNEGRVEDEEPMKSPRREGRGGTRMERTDQTTKKGGGQLSLRLPPVGIRNSTAA
ncbi:hypothetical protein Pcinc_000535 [Petrolisthes cinctipes]|uniref:Uncharacterized protein n=1 Tax=Petrolisthes cinctipes TaxID=88211 RepID=A0AAE1L575_PETCI|nr:hypothetical protein Pcinc_000535 [Petrolisthes cinctipes]